ncbi:MAG: Uma2 family endonuclease [Myxococcales bacterium]|nr:Uma2 family endonuclease [Myxococcales bacterium]
MSSVPAPEPIRLTCDDYRGLPDDGRRYELFEGELQATPSPTTRHQRVCRDLECLLHSHVRAHGLGEVLHAPIDVILDRATIVQPDILFVAAARLAIIKERGIEGPPDLVVEILSESTADRDRGVKQQLYARYGVAHYWIVDAAAQTLAEYQLEERAYRLRGTYGVGQPARPALFSDLPIDLNEIFH